MKDNKLRSAIAENPVLVLFLGAAPAMGSTADVRAALGMGGAVLLVLLLSSALISLLRRVIPQKAMIPASILIIAGFVSVIELLMNAFLPSVYQMLGVYLAVIAVNLLVFSGGERAVERGFGAAMLDSLLTGLGFAAAIFVMAALREVFGSGSFAGIAIPFLENHNVPLLVQSSGGFIIFAFLIACINGLRRKDNEPARGFAGVACGLCDAQIGTEGE